LGRLSVQACVFRSGHAAAVAATAWAVRTYRPRLGVLFCVLALGIAAATVYGRCHYTAEAVAGVCVGVVGFMISRRISSSRHGWLQRLQFPHDEPKRQQTGDENEWG
jgi:membrane-associated phospholipid phosphatase